MLILMRRLLFAAAAIPAALLLSSCGGKGDPGTEGAAELASALTQALLAGDREGFVRLHVAQGDGDPSGDYLYVAWRGADNAGDWKRWEGRVRSAYAAARTWIEAHASEPLAFERVLAVEPSGEPNKGGRIGSMDVLVSGGAKRYRMRIGESVLTARGRLCVQEPGVVFEPYTEPSGG
jgi:hypothetical protein